MRHAIILGALLLCLESTGCGEKFGQGGTGEMVVPRQQLREIHGTDLRDVGTTQPTTSLTTLPTTLPTPPPAPEVSFTIAQVRQIALENNLDLKVDLLNPTIAKEGLNA